MRGSLRGVITRVLDDGRVAVRPDGGMSELLSLPESLLPDELTRGAKIQIQSPRAK